LDDIGLGAVGGVTAEESNWPFLVRLVLGRGLTTGTCGGTVIADEWILTAAHCCKASPFGKLIRIQITIFNKYLVQTIIGTTYWQSFKLPKIESFNHPLYVTDGHPQHNKAYDICLIKTNSISEAAKKNRCDYGSCFGAVCLPTEPPKHGKHCWLAGYGATKMNGQAVDDLQELD